MSGIWLVSYVALWVVVVVQSILLLGLARELGVIHAGFGSPGALLTEDGLSIGSHAPSFSAVEIPTGREVAFHGPGENDAVIVFVAPDCGPCRELLPGLAAGASEWGRSVRFHVVCAGDEHALRALLENTGIQMPLLADPLTAIRAKFEHPPTPYAFLIDADGVIKLKGVANSRDAIDRLIDGQARVSGGRRVFADHRSQRAARRSEQEVGRERFGSATLEQRGGADFSA